MDPGVAVEARLKGLGYKTAIEHGIFCELGRGCVDFSGVVARLNEWGYSGWLTVEQDRLPGLGTPKESALRNRKFLRMLGL